MEKIKNILNDENLATDQTTSSSGMGSGTGQTSGLSSGTTAHQGLTGEGSHLASNRDTLGSSNTATSSGLGGNSNTTSTGLGNSQNTGLSSQTGGPHSSNLANKADPRVDTGVDNSRTVGGVGNTTSSGMGGTQNMTSSGLGNTQNTGLSSQTAGPHSSNLANKADPRVDSDLDNSRTAGGVGNTTSSGMGRNQNTTSSGLGNTQNTGLSSGTETTGPHSSNLANKADPRVDSDRDGSRTAGGVGTTSAGYGTSNTNDGTRGDTGFSGPHRTEAANRLDPSVNTSSGVGLESAQHHSATHGGGGQEADRQHGSHVGRDAAVGAGAVGLAEHEHHKHHGQQSSGIGGASSTTGTGNTSTGTDPAHPHKSHLANLVDPRVDPNMDGSRGHTSDPYTAAADSHYGRDATIGAAGVGAAGVGAASSSQSSAPNTTGPHKQDWLNKLDPRVNAHPDQPQSTGHGPLKVTEGQTGTAKPYDPTTGYVSNPHHHGVSDVNPDGSTSQHANPTHHGQSRGNDLPGRSAAAAGAVEGGGYYEAGKNHGTQSGIGGTSSSTTAGPHSSNVANKADPTVDSDRSKDHHYGRDAGLAGGAGAVAYEADKHQQKHDKDLTAAEREAKKEHKHELKEEKRELKEEKREHKESKGGLLSFLHRDKNKKYTKEEEADFDRQEREHNSHKGRDALGGAAVGGAAYEGEKHHRDHQNASAVEGNTNKALPTAPGNHGIGTGEGTQNALASDNNTSNTSGHHLGRDAAAVGGVGALGEHEHNKNSTTTGSGLNATPLDQKPAGTDLGDKLHGVERNRGVQGSTGFPHSGTGSSTTGTGATDQHHYGRDATAVGGAATLGEHEHRKHENENVGSAGYGNQSSGITDSSTGTGNQHHLGRDAAVGAGGVGLAEHEHQKHEGVTGSGYGNASSGLNREYDSSNTGFQSGTGVQSGTGERNRLHKDPPANHPAAQATQGGVPASGSERANLIGEGEERLTDNTGVANAHGQGNVNAASNY